jgi:NADH-quinone oxidoreductase subunit K
MSALSAPAVCQLVACALFGLGAGGALLRRNTLVLWVGLTLMLQAGNLAFVGYARAYGDVRGQMAVLVLMATAAVEAVLALALTVGILTERHTLDVDELDALRDET